MVARSRDDGPRPLAPAHHGQKPSLLAALGKAPSASGASRRIEQTPWRRSQASATAWRLQTRRATQRGLCGQPPAVAHPYRRCDQHAAAAIAAHLRAGAGGGGGRLGHASRQGDMQSKRGTYGCILH